MKLAAVANLIPPRARPGNWPLLRALRGADPESLPMSDAEAATLERLRDGAVVRLCFRTRATADTGEWLTNAPVWLAVAGEELLAFAAGKRPFTARARLAALPDSRYNHVTGELLLLPWPDARARRLPMSPLRAEQVLELINQEVNRHA
jgi:hypothetical protein